MMFVILPCLVTYLNETAEDSIGNDFVARDKGIIHDDHVFVRNNRKLYKIAVILWT